MHEVVPAGVERSWSEVGGLEAMTKNEGQRIGSRDWPLGNFLPLIFVYPRTGFVFIRGYLRPFALIKMETDRSSTRMAPHFRAFRVAAGGDSRRGAKSWLSVCRIRRSPCRMRTISSRILPPSALFCRKCAEVEGDHDGAHSAPHFPQPQPPPQPGFFRRLAARTMKSTIVISTTAPAAMVCHSVFMREIGLASYPAPSLSPSD